jgi:uncharacterized protein (DUF1501 family)
MVMKRRDFLHSAIGATALPALPFSISVAEAAGGITPNAEEGGYKALVCVFLFGGNDNHNTVVPYQSSEYSAYLNARGGLASANGLALPQANLQPLIAPGGSAATAPLALHPAMTRIGSIYTAGKMAIVANAGPLLDETTLAQYSVPGHPLPPQLFSHSDMQMHWQTMIPDQPADTGWGGRMADVFRIASAGRLPVGIAVGGGGLFMKGDLTVPYSVTPMRYDNVPNSNPPVPRINPRSPVVRTPNAAIDWNWTGSLPQEVFKQNYMEARANLLEQQYAKTVRASLEVGEFARSAMYNVDTSGNYSFKSNPGGALDIARWAPSNPLAAQLHSVAAMIAARSALGTTRQVFFVSLGGFDNHGDQFGTTNGGKRLVPDPPFSFNDTPAQRAEKIASAGKHFILLNYVDEALKAFYDATVSMGVANNVTTMTMSDFGRTIKSNGQGSDHGWGGHYFVLGGAVKGGKVLGAQTPGGAVTSYFPMASQIGAYDVGEGRLLPTISSDAYVATLAKWFGANNTELGQIFPNLSRFNVQNLDLMV